MNTTKGTYRVYIRSIHPKNRNSFRNPLNTHILIMKQNLIKLDYFLSSKKFDLGSREDKIVKLTSHFDSSTFSKVVVEDKVDPIWINL